MTDRYNTPQEGTLDWHVPLNDNFDALETDVEIRDAESNLSNYDPTPGAKFFATDTGAVYVGTDSGWEAVGVVPDPAIHVGAERPSNPSDGDVWIDTS
jgi:hypothetical protein